MFISLMLSLPGVSMAISDDRVRVDILGGDARIMDNVDAEIRCSLVCDMNNRSWTNEWSSDEEGSYCYCAY